MKYGYGEELWDHCTYKWNNSLIAFPLQPLCPRDQQAHTQPSTCQHQKRGCQMELPRELHSEVKQQWGERQALYMLLKAPSWEKLKTQRDFWHGHPLHWHRYNCAKTVQRCLIAFTFGRISVSWYWYPYTAIFHVYTYIERDFCSWLLEFTILYHCSAKSEVSLWTSEYWSSPPTMHTKNPIFPPLTIPQNKNDPLFLFGKK